MNRGRKGDRFDLEVTRHLEADGWVVASRRHLSGPGDLLAVKMGTPGAGVHGALAHTRGRLIECKRGAGSPYENFRAPDRAALSAYAAEHGLVAELAWRKDRGKLEFIAEADWP